MTSQFAWGQPSRRLPPLATSDLAFSSANQHNPASPFTSFQAGVRQPQSVPAGSNITSPRSRTVTPLSHLANTATATSSLQGEPGGGGGLSLGGRSGTYSPSLSGTNLGSPTIAGFERTSSLPASAGSGSGQSSLTIQSRTSRARPSGRSRQSKLKRYNLCILRACGVMLTA